MMEDFSDDELVEVASVASSTASTAAASPAVRQVTVDRSLEQMATTFSKEQAQRHIKQLNATLLVRHDILVKVRALVNRILKKEKPRFLRDSCRYLHEVPDYIIRELLSYVLGEPDESVFKNMSNASNKLLMYFVVAGYPGLKLPQAGMEVAKLLAWARLRWEAHGCRIQGVAFTAESLNWECAIGIFSYVIPDGPGDTMVTEVQLNSDKRVVPLPMGFSCKKCEVSMIWFIRDNYHEDEAYLFNAKRQTQQKLGPLFNGEKEDVEARLHCCLIDGELSSTSF